MIDIFSGTECSLKRSLITGIIREKQNKNIGGRERERERVSFRADRKHLEKSELKHDTSS